MQGWVDKVKAVDEANSWALMLELKAAIAASEEAKQAEAVTAKKTWDAPIGDYPGDEAVKARMGTIASKIDVNAGKSARPAPFRATTATAAVINAAQ